MTRKCQLKYKPQKKDKFIKHLLLKRNLDIIGKQKIAITNYNKL